MPQKQIAMKCQNLNQLVPLSAYQKELTRFLGLTENQAGINVSKSRHIPTQQHASTMKISASIFCACANNHIEKGFRTDASSLRCKS